MLRAPRRWPGPRMRRATGSTLLVDHANCEKKAASTALALMFAYPEDRTLCLALARLAREELRHFEQVQKLMAQLGVPCHAPGAGSLCRWAARRACDRASRSASVDLLLCGALIEARSCERFEVLAPHLHEPLAGFYADLARSERRHAGLYLELAPAATASGEPATRLDAAPRRAGERRGAS